MTREESFSSHDGEVARAISAIFGLVHTKAQFWVELKNILVSPKGEKTHLREQREDEAVSAAHVPFDLEVSEIKSILTSMMGATIILKDNEDNEDDSSDDGDYDDDDIKKYNADVLRVEIILILQGVTYKRSVAKEQGPYHESCGLCSPNILVCQRHQFVVPYDKVSDVAENHVR